MTTHPYTEFMKGMDLAKKIDYSVIEEKVLLGDAPGYWLDGKTSMYSADPATKAAQKVQAYHYLYGGTPMKFKGNQSVSDLNTSLKKTGAFAVAAQASAAGMQKVIKKELLQAMHKNGMHPTAKVKKLMQDGVLDAIKDDKKMLDLLTSEDDETPPDAPYSCMKCYKDHNDTPFHGLCLPCVASYLPTNVLEEVAFSWWPAMSVDERVDRLEAAGWYKNFVEVVDLSNAAKLDAVPSPEYKHGKVSYTGGTITGSFDPAPIGAHGTEAIAPKDYEQFKFVGPDGKDQMPPPELPSLDDEVYEKNKKAVDELTHLKPYQPIICLGDGHLTMTLGNGSEVKVFNGGIFELKCYPDALMLKGCKPLQSAEAIEYMKAAYNYEGKIFNGSDIDKGALTALELARCKLLAWANGKGWHNAHFVALPGTPATAGDIAHPDDKWSPAPEAKYKVYLYTGGAPIQAVDTGFWINQNTLMTREAINKSIPMNTNMKLFKEVPPQLTAEYITTRLLYEEAVNSKETPSIISTRYTDLTTAWIHLSADVKQDMIGTDPAWYPATVGGVFGKKTATPVVPGTPDIPDAGTSKSYEKFEFKT